MRKPTPPYMLMLIILFSFMFLSISYAGYTDTIEITGTVTTHEDFHIMDLVGHWKLDENDGTVAFDSSPYHNDGTIVGDPYLLGPGYYIFDGDGDYISVPDKDSLDLTTNITILIWLNADDWNNPDTPEPYHYNVTQLVDKGEHQTSSGFGLYSLDNETLNFRINKQHDIFTSLPTVNHPHLIAATYNQVEGRMRLYVDGDLKEEDSYNQPIELNNDPLTIGNGFNREYYFNGTMYDVKLYATEFSPIEIQHYCNSGIPD